MRYDINSLRSAEHIAPQVYRILLDISQIPPGIYIAASHKWLAKPQFEERLSFGDSRSCDYSFTGENSPKGTFPVAAFTKAFTLGESME